jgi:LysM repeat protein
MDYSGAIEAFEASLEANPHSAPAHFQLAWLYSEKENDPAAAIYHYQQYLRFDPKASNAEVVTGRISACKLQLAQGLLGMPSSPAAMQQLQQLADKNRQLQEEVDKWRAYYESQQAAGKTNPPAANANPASQSDVAAASPAPAAAANPPPVARPRTHKVVAGDTPLAIARKYNVNVNSVLRANPGLNPRKLRVGQIINLPPP